MFGNDFVYENMHCGKVILSDNKCIISNVDITVVNNCVKNTRRNHECKRQESKLYIIYIYCLNQIYVYF